MKSLWWELSFKPIKKHVSWREGNIIIFSKWFDKATKFVLVENPPFCYINFVHAKSIKQIYLTVKNKKEEAEGALTLYFSPTVRRKAKVNKGKSTSGNTMLIPYHTVSYCNACTILHNWRSKYFISPFERNYYYYYCKINWAGPVLNKFHVIARRVKEKWRADFLL